MTKNNLTAQTYWGILFARCLGGIEETPIETYQHKKITCLGMTCGVVTILFGFAVATCGAMMKEPILEIGGVPAGIIFGITSFFFGNLIQNSLFPRILTDLPTETTHLVQQK